MDQLLTLASTFGGPGLLIAFMVWDRKNTNELAEKRIAADIAMAQAMTIIATKLDHLYAR